MKHLSSLASDFARPATFLLVASCFFNLAAASLQATIPIPAEKENIISLNGKWRFKLEQALPPSRFLGTGGRPLAIEYPATTEPFFKSDYLENKSWHDLAVPGNWEMAGFSPATYNQPDNASGFYRLKFKVPAKWNGRLVRINFDGVQNGCEIWCNGQPVAVDLPSWGRTNYHESGWTAWQADLTPAIRFGQENLLALRVTKNNKGIDCDSGDFFLLGGVHRPVTLFSVPRSHLRDLIIQTKLLPDDQAEVKVIAQVENAARRSKISMQIEGQPTIDGNADDNGQITLTQIVSHPKLWSSEFPNLSTLSLDLKDSDARVVEHLSRKIGIREVSIKKGIFYVNNVPVKLVGICRHDVYPTLGTALNEEVWKKDLLLMKAANFNAVRTSHYPYGSGFYDLCDQLGFYVLDEEPFCWVNCDDPELTPAFEQRARETVARDKNHPCVVIWGIGNENKPGRNNALAAKITRELDPTRPRLISCQRGDQGSEGVEFDDAHYTATQQIRKAEGDKRRTRWPMIYTENPNVWDVRNGPDYGSLDLWGAVIDRTWKEVWHDDHVVGSFLWEWQDRAVADKCTNKFYTYYPRTGINVIKVKGVVDAFRNPRPEYYHIKMAQSPIAIGEKPQISGDHVILDLTNRYSFTDLSTLTVNWRLIDGSQTLKQGTAKIELPARSNGQVRLELPAGARDADTLRLDFNHPGGWNVATYQFPIKPAPQPTPPQLEPVKGLTFPDFNLVTGELGRDASGWKHLNSVAATLANVKIKRAGGETTDIDSKLVPSIPLADVRTLDGDVILPGSTAPAGHVHAEISNGKMNYQVSWSGKKIDAYELGWVFHAPKGLDRFSWNRQAVWSYYPPDHIGRSSGTARPDSARVDLTKVDRPDAFDFNSTKFDCNWASLTDAHHHGLSISFAPKERQHVRGGFDSKGNCTLIVNRCYSPPRDISTHLVTDFYTTLKKGDKISGTFEIN